MYFRTAAATAILACAAHASAEPVPYKPLAAMAVSHLFRRDTDGYQPEQSVCSGEGDTCAAACGSGYTECGVVGESMHCFNPEAGQTCCSDGTGNSCDAGYYCTHDSKNETFCCPDSMDLEACAAAYSVTGGLETPAPATTSAAPTSSAEPTTSEAPTTTSAEPTTSSVVEEDEPTSTVQSTLVVVNGTTITTTVCPTTATPGVPPTTSIPIGSNSTITSGVPSQPVESSNPPAPSTTPGTAGAAATGVSAMLLLAAGVVALL